MSALARPEKITFAEVRAAGARGVLLWCCDDRCSHWTRLDADRRANELRLSDMEDRFTCTACGKRGADVRPDFNWNKPAVPMMGYR